VPPPRQAASEPPPPAVEAKRATTEVETVRAPEEVLASAVSDSIRPNAPSGSGIVERPRPSLPESQQTSTLASGSVPGEAPAATPKPPKSIAPAPEPEPATTKASAPPAAPQSNRAVPVLIGIVVLLLLVILFLVGKK
jgi:hypothetical protein